MCNIEIKKPVRMSDQWRKNKVRKLSLKELRQRKTILQNILNSEKEFMENWLKSAIKIEKAKPLSLIEEIRKYFREALIKSNPKF